MSVSAYIKKKLLQFGLPADDAEIGVLLTARGADPDGGLTPASMVDAKHVIVSLVPELLLAPDISQGDYSRKFDRNAVVKYYGLLCDELGVENGLDPQPRVYDASNRW